MQDIYLLDCTLRDGGYTNDWNFGKAAIGEIVQKMFRSGVEIVEVGFLRDKPTLPDRAVWNDIHDIDTFLPKERGSTQFAVMCEVFSKFPLEKLAPKDEKTVDIIRVIVWKSMIPEALEYCRGIVERGYRLCIQPDRVNQYTAEEFQDLISQFSVLDPMAIYVVDSNGFLGRRELVKYFKAADEALPPQVCLGYHGHNNLQQTMGAAECFAEMGLDRDIIIDASVMGIGRSGGNLHIELISQYLNQYWNKKYNISNMIEIFETYLRASFEKKPWGYCLPAFISSIHQCNPNYGFYLADTCKLPLPEVEEIISQLPTKDRVIYNKDAVIPFLKGHEIEN